MKRSWVIIAWVGVVLAAVFLRFDDLGSRPMHADEATGARITAQRLESDDWRFDPTHYHGPLLSDMAMLVCRLRGEAGWHQMTAYGLRLVPVLAGVLLVGIPWLWRRRTGDLAALLAAGMLATSPLLVYYSRMFIHEMLLVLFGIAAVALLTTGARRWLPGVMIGLMFAAKESFAISLLAWSGAAVMLVFAERKHIDWSNISGLLVKAWSLVWPSLVAAGVTAMAFYTQGFRDGQGTVDAVRTFFVYQTVDGHDKPLPYYLELLLVPHKAAGVWWFGAPVFLLALMAVVRSFGSGIEPPVRRTIWFLAYAVVGHAAIYSLIRYKTPWLACLPWAHVCCLAGFAAAGWRSRPLAWKASVAALALVALASQWHQARMACGRLNSDARNPYAYVPTRRDAAAMGEWLAQLRAMKSGQAWHGVAVIGTGYWPLPWYLRGLEPLDYWREPPDGIGRYSVVIAMPEQAQAVAARVPGSHVMVPRGLRADVPVDLHVRRDLWDAWMQDDQR